MAFISFRMEIFILDNGKTINLKAKELIFLPILNISRVNLSKDKVHKEYIFT